MIDMKQLEAAAERARRDDEIFGPVDLRFRQERKPPPLVIDPARIIEAVAAYYHVPVNAILARNTHKTVVYPRMTAVHLCRTLTRQTYMVLAKSFNRGHCDLIHADRWAMRTVRRDPIYRAQVQELAKMIVA